MTKQFLIWTGIMGALVVALGAFGAHGLKASLPSNQLEVYQTAVSYHFYHTFGLGLAAVLSLFHSNKFIHWAAWSFIIGILLFSGSLYLLSTRELIGLTNYRWLGPITPIGGLLFMIGWIFMAMAGWTLDIRKITISKPEQVKEKINA
ncbi:MAG: DUF423 domain-containing protein [Bacteroidota bacterium]